MTRPTSRSPGLTHAASRGQPRDAAPRTEYRDIDAVIDARAVNTVFQPLVRLDSREIVGFEALSRGPAGSPWQAPSALFPAAEAAGRLAELDWICRVRAYQHALHANLDPLITLFVNTEPLALRTECPPDLSPWLSAARRGRSGSERNGA